MGDEDNSSNNSDFVNSNASSISITEVRKMNYFGKASSVAMSFENETFLSKGTDIALAKAMECVRGLRIDDFSCPSQNMTASGMWGRTPLLNSSSEELLPETPIAQNARELMTRKFECNPMKDLEIGGESFGWSCGKLNLSATIDLWPSPSNAEVEERIAHRMTSSIFIEDSDNESFEEMNVVNKISARSVSSTAEIDYIKNLGENAPKSCQSGRLTLDMFSENTETPTPKSWNSKANSEVIFDYAEDGRENLTPDENGNLPRDSQNQKVKVFNLRNEQLNSPTCQNKEKTSDIDGSFKLEISPQIGNVLHLRRQSSDNQEQNKMSIYKKFYKRQFKSNVSKCFATDYPVKGWNHKKETKPNETNALVSEPPKNLKIVSVTDTTATGTRKCFKFGNMAQKTHLRRSERIKNHQKSLVSTHRCAKSSTVGRSNRRKERAVKANTEWISPSLRKFIESKLKKSRKSDFEKIKECNKMLDIISKTVQSVMKAKGKKYDTKISNLKETLLNTKICLTVHEFYTLLRKHTPFEFQRRVLPLGGTCNCKIPAIIP